MAESRGPQRFAPLDWIVGEWQGYGEFTDRTTFIHKSFYYDVGGMFLVERTIDIFPPPEPSTEFELHQDISLFYALPESGAFRARGFYVEGFVTAADVHVSEDGDSFTVESTGVDNGPPGMRSRITYTRRSDTRFTALFELAMPGKDYAKVEDLTMDRIV